MYISELICIMIYYNIFSPAESIDIDEDLDVIFHKGADDEENIQEPGTRKRSMSGQGETGSASKKLRLSQNENDGVIEL